MTSKEYRDRTSSIARPYAMVGAGRLVSTVWKAGDESRGWRYRFNLFRMSANGRAGHQFRPADVVSLVKLAKVLAAELTTDGCLDAELRGELARLTSALDQIIPTKD